MLISLNGLNTTEITYPGAPSVEEQMMLFHTGPLNLVTENVQTVKEDGHKQQAIEARVMPLTSKGCLDPEEGCQPHMGDVTPGVVGKRGVPVKKLLVGFAAGLLVGFAVSKLR